MTSIQTVCVVDIRQTDAVSLLCCRFELIRNQMDFYQRFGRQLRQARKSAGLSQADLAVAIKLTRTSISNIEQGRQKVLLHTFVELLHVLNMQSAELLPAAQSSPILLGLNSLARDEREFVERGLGRLGKEKHDSSMDTNSEGSQRVVGEV